MREQEYVCSTDMHNLVISRFFIHPFYLGLVPKSLRHEWGYLLYTIFEVWQKFLIDTVSVRL